MESSTMHRSPLVDEIIARWPAVLVGAVVLLLGVVLERVFSGDPLSKLPFIGKGQGDRYAKGGAWEMYAEGYRKFKDGLFRITTNRESDSLVVSSAFLPELKKLPDDVLSFTAAVQETMQVKYTGFEVDLPTLPHTVKASLTPALVRLNPVVAQEVKESMVLEVPQKKEWTETNINSALLRIVAMASGRIFVGPELCRDQTYLDAAIHFTVDLMEAVQRVGEIPQWRRQLQAPLLPEVRKLRQRSKDAENLLRPIVAARKAAAEKENYEKPDDMLQWIIDSQDKSGPQTDAHLAETQLAVSFAAIHTTTVTTTNCVYSLAAMPEITPMLREDIKQALADQDGQFNSASLQNMKKLDSFIKEVMRHHPLGATSFTRKVLRPFTLSNGQKIPAGIVIEVPAGPINADEEIFPDPEKFDALRFYKLRQSKEHAQSTTKAAEVVASSQFIGVGPTSLLFGYGRHACPGRFFAANEIKMILANFLLDYDIRMPDGIEGRYENWRTGAGLVPDPTKTIMVRRL